MVFLVFFAVSLLIGIGSAKAQGSYLIARLPCNTTELVLKMLEGEYKELPIGSGQSRGSKISLYTSHGADESKQTWTIIITQGDMSCVMKGGEDWIVNPKIIKGDPS